MHISGDAVFDLRVNVLAEVLEALPSTCVALGADTNSRDVQNTEPIHLCAIIRAIVPRLHHLRLRWKYLCLTVIYTEGLKYLSSNHHGPPDRLSTADHIEAPKS